MGVEGVLLLGLLYNLLELEGLGKAGVSRP